MMVQPVFREELLERRRQLEAVAPELPAPVEARRLLNEIDEALGRVDAGTFGLCEACGDPIEADRLAVDPLTRFCLDHLTPFEQRALEQDLELAVRIQRGLLPKPDAALAGWEVAYHYQPAGPVSGDYCDLIPGASSQGYFLVGDVAGKGVAAAMLMSHLSAMLRTLISVGLPLGELVERASRVFCESTLPAHYATLVCGRASASGEIELCNAGHPPPLLVRGSVVTPLDATGLPIGMFCSEQFSSRTERLDPGDTLLIYTDGLIEARNRAGDDYGADRLRALASSAGSLRPRAIVDACMRDLVAFGAAPRFADDLTIMALRRM